MPWECVAYSWVCVCVCVWVWHVMCALSLTSRSVRIPCKYKYPVSDRVCEICTARLQNLYWKRGSLETPESYASEVHCPTLHVKCALRELSQASESPFDMHIHVRLTNMYIIYTAQDYTSHWHELYTWIIQQYTDNSCECTSHWHELYNRWTCIFVT